MSGSSFLPAWLDPDGEHATTARQVAQFGMVGAVGFAFDTGTVYALRDAIGLYGAGLVGYVVAASVNWLLNRTWTFRDRRRDGLRRQWLRFMIANLAGLVLNRGAYSLLIANFALAARIPVLAVAAGAVAGFGVNFLFSRHFVFR